MAVEAGVLKAFVSADVPLDEGSPVVGSFAVDGLTYAVTGEGVVELVSVSDGLQQVTGPDDGLDLPMSVDYEGMAYSLTSIAPYAFHLSEVQAVTIPATVSSIDERAFRASSVGSIEADGDNPVYSSHDGALYSVDQSCILLVPEGRSGQLRVSSQAEMAEQGVFSHCASLEAIAVDAGCPGFSSENGLLYDVSGETLLRVPAGATDITIKDGCTTIAAGAMEGCAKLESITAPASVSSISPYAFSQEPATVSLPAATLVDGSGSEAASAAQLSSTVALTASDDALPEVDPASMQVTLPEGADATAWQAAGFTPSMVPSGVEGPLGDAGATLQDVASNRAGGFSEYVVNVYGAERYRCKQWNKTFTQLIKEWTHWNANLSISRIESWNVDGSKVGYWTDAFTYSWDAIPLKTGYTLTRFTYADGSTVTTPVQNGNQFNAAIYCNWRPNSYTISLDPQGGSVSQSSIAATYDQDVTLPEPTRSGYRFLGWDTAPDGTGERYQAGAVRNLTDQDGVTVLLYAQWKPYVLGFDTSSEPGDADYPGGDKADQEVSVGDGQVEIEPPTRPGYIFQGWVPEGKPNDEGLLTEGADGTWSVDASKLPDYADGNGKVNLTARWTAAISVDAPISATFMYDLSAWDGTESRDAMTVEGSSTVRNRSAIPIRVSGLESETGSAANVLKKADGTTLADASKGDEAKVLSVFPTTSDSTGTESDAKGGATDDAGDDLAHKVDLALSEIKLEADFDADAWAIPAGASANGAVTAPGEAKLGYRLNLGSSTGVTLDKDALLAATGDPEAGSSSKAASIAELTYCFALEGINKDIEPIYIEYGDRDIGTQEILRAAEDISEKGEASPYYQEYVGIMAAQGKPTDGYLPADAEAKVYAKYDGPEATASQPNCDRAGYVRLLLLGVNHDVLELKEGYPDASGFAGDGSKDPVNGEPYVAKRAGLTFQFMDVLFSGQMNTTDTNAGGWASSYMRNALLSESGAIYQSLAVKGSIKPVWRFRNGKGGGALSSGKGWGNVVAATRDALSLLTAREAYGLVPNDDHVDGAPYDWVNHCGFQYAYIGEVCGVHMVKTGPYSADIINQKALVDRRGPSGKATWWLLWPNGVETASFHCAGDLWSSVASDFLGIAPTFCL